MLSARRNFTSGIYISTNTTVKNLILLILAIPMLVIGISGCEDSDAESPIIVFVDPNETTIEANANERILLNVSASTNVGTTLNMKVESRDLVFGVVQHFDSTFAQPSINYVLDYIIPQYPDSTESILKFTFTNSAQNQIEIARRLLINKGASLVTETSGHVIHSLASSQPNAFSLDAVAPGYLQDTLTFSVDIYDTSDELVNGETLSRSWESFTGLNFVEFNGFNYASANSLTIKSAYESGLKLTRISGVQSGDVYMVGRGNTALGAIQIVAVVDQPGVEEDSYNFNLKKINQ
ncbi:hypothetical protein [Fulvivirga lutea]|uniref:Uncharacterized protein n=1 Tax=Fulvivirga lutea TaxID=2810512 RepID=A0A974WH63_9BACT|nr:hypothetical protein [Fulvivirga lutea]QSE97628.1 hypothetical protein JR347_00640 [Fulvivirga lutea]